MKEEYIEKVLAETKNKKGVLEEIIKDQEVNVTDDGLQTISVLAET